MTIIRPAALAILCAALPLAGCDGLAALGGAPARTAAPAPEAAPDEAPAPEVFDLTAQGLWDGRPSLGGVWVAHPDVTAPERVRIASGDTAIAGALFRRERDSAGPPFQLSSEAATLLGIPPGTARSLTVTALRPVPAPVPVPVPESGPAPDAPPAPGATDP